jgi:hypothetical protein
MAQARVQREAMETKRVKSAQSEISLLRAGIIKETKVLLIRPASVSWLILE